MNDYLYHYTSIEKLALILKNRTIKFNNLMNVDDPEEAETEDLGKAGRHCLISCWTDKSEDNIPMWNMYTSNMKGVRIGMKRNPFKKYTYKKGEDCFSKDIQSCINYYSDYSKIVSIVAVYPLLEKVEYTNKEDLLKPKILTRSENEATVSVGKIGKYKRTYWTFQQEYRYVIRTAPWSNEELKKVETPEEQIQIFNRILDINNTQFCNEIFLELADDAFDNMEILLAPKTSEPEFIIVESLIDKYCKGNHVDIKNSKIKIR